MQEELRNCGCSCNNNCCESNNCGGLFGNLFNVCGC